SRRAWPVSRLREVRAAVEYAIFALLEHELRHPPWPYLELFRRLRREDIEPRIISLNYDIYADNALMAVSGEGSEVGPLFPEYRCDIRTPFYLGQPPHDGQSPYWGQLLKLHGSLNWLCCPACHRLDLAIAESGLSTVKSLREIYPGSDRASLERHYAEGGHACDDCGTPVDAVLVTPSGRKDYQNPHLARIWYEADRMLRETDRVVIVGYSLPDDDLEVMCLLKR